ncbi:Ger(x)C family spore germination protein [Cohnella luojiensis]|uniref:Ger(X)C family spore germination protein n=1 Tax=Cohnella luojiensis TaxID=652876 RepID=A0A4Y8M174_9BACL|nr:Ger(x)C family spore germination protein [Cohnella luojiensis]TFE28593.1 Ger(x)C family spore germination protein [Cohnella luojiensis]
MNSIKKLLIAFSLLSLLAGCSPDVREISDTALVMSIGVDYDKENKKYTFTTYCILPAMPGGDKTGKLSEWVASGSGESFLDAAKNLRSRAGKSLIFQHAKFFIVGEEAARYSFYEIVDFLSRNRQIRITSYLIVSEGKAADKLQVKSDSGDLISNELLGKVRNEKEWGKSITMIIRDIVNLFPSQYRGYVTSRLSTAQSKSKPHEILILKGGAVFYKGKFIDWLDGNDTITVHLLSKKSRWKELEIAEVIHFQSLKLSVFYHVSNSVIHSSFVQGTPKMNIDIQLNATMGNMDHNLNLNRREVILQLEQAAARQMAAKIQKSIDHFQKGLKVDVLGFSDRFIQYHPKGWTMLKKDWDAVYPTIPVQVHVSVKIEQLGMIQSMGVE